MVFKLLVFVLPFLRLLWLSRAVEVNSQASTEDGVKHLQSQSLPRYSAVTQRVSLLIICVRLSLLWSNELQEEGQPFLNTFSFYGIELLEHHFLDIVFSKIAR